MLREFLKITIMFKRQSLEEGFGKGNIETYIDEVKSELSSGYQAIFRVFSEILFLKSELKEKGTIVIDELDEFLSPNRARDILQYLIVKFPE